MTIPIAIVASVALICITAFITPVVLKGMDLKENKPDKKA